MKSTWSMNIFLKLGVKSLKIVINVWPSHFYLIPLPPHQLVGIPNISLTHSPQAVGLHATYWLPTDTYHMPPAMTFFFLPKHFFSPKTYFHLNCFSSETVIKKMLSKKNVTIFFSHNFFLKICFFQPEFYFPKPFLSLPKYFFAPKIQHP